MMGYALAVIFMLLLVGVPACLLRMLRKRRFNTGTAAVTSMVLAFFPLVVVMQLGSSGPERLAALASGGAAYAVLRRKSKAEIKEEANAHRQRMGYE